MKTFKFASCTEPRNYPWPSLGDGFVNIDFLLPPLLTYPPKERDVHIHMVISELSSLRPISGSDTLVTKLHLNKSYKLQSLKKLAHERCSSF